MPIPLGILAVAGAGAAGGTSSFDLLETTLISSNTASVTFSNLNNYSDYKHLQLRITARSSRSANVSMAQIKFNSSSTNYAHHGLEGTAGTVSSQASTSTTAIWRLQQTAATNTANAFGAIVIDILDFSNTSKNTTIRALSGQAATESIINLVSGLWYQTNAVTSIEIADFFAANFVSGSRFSLYGIR